jgi:hypothetical protein
LHGNQGNYVLMQAMVAAGQGAAILPGLALPPTGATRSSRFR